MAQGIRPGKEASRPIPYWSQVLRALRDARGITQEGWAAQLGYSRATVRRWESGRTVPSADAERAIVALCREKRLFQKFHEGPLLGVTVTPEWIADQLAMARLQIEVPSVSSGEAPESLSIPPVYYASNGNVSLAYQEFGKGPVTFVITPGTISHRELEWENPGIRSFLLHLSQYGRVVIYDKRSTGLSDRVSHGTSTDRINDLRAVMDAAECDEAILVGFTEGGPISIKFAATWPDRVKALVLYGTSAQVPNVSPETDVDSYDRLQRVWGTPESGFLEKFAPSVSFDKRELDWWARFQRMGASPGAIRDLNAMNATLDVMSLLPDLQPPTLVIHRTGDSVTPFQEAVHMSQIIPDARLVTLEGDDHMAWAGDALEISGAIVDFVNGLIPKTSTNYMLTTMMGFSHPEIPRPLRQVPSCTSGRVFNTVDNGPLLTFDSPSNAIQCAIDLQANLEDSEQKVGIGIHVGEVNRDSHTISGEAVLLCEQLAKKAEPGTVLITESVALLASDPRYSFRQNLTANGSSSDNNCRTFRIEVAGSSRKSKSSEAK